MEKITEVFPELGILLAGDIVKAFLGAKIEGIDLKIPRKMFTYFGPFKPLRLVSEPQIYLLRLAGVLMTDYLQDRWHYKVDFVDDAELATGTPPF